MQYNSFEAEDFASDPAFVQWVRYPNDQLDAFWKDWLEQHPEKADTIMKARRLVNFLQFSTEQPLAGEQDEVKRSIRDKIASPSITQLHQNQRPTRWQPVAAAVALLVLGMAAMWYFYLTSPYTYYETAYSEQREILLPDSTLVTLNANSELRVKSDWSETGAREVWLQGEAYFNVVKKPQADDGRFIVHAGQLDVEVLGTAFNVLSRRGNAEVVLNEGKVELWRPRQGQRLTMKPGEKASLDADQRLSKVNVNPELYASWKDNRLFFDNASLREIFLRIQDIHGYEIKVSDPQLLQRQFTGSCPVNDLTILTTALAETFNLTVERDGKQIIFHPDTNNNSN